MSAIQCYINKKEEYIKFTTDHIFFQKSNTQLAYKQIKAIQIKNNEFFYLKISYIQKEETVMFIEFRSVFKRDLCKNLILYTLKGEENEKTEIYKMFFETEQLQNIFNEMNISIHKFTQLYKESFFYTIDNRSKNEIDTLFEKYLELPELTIATRMNHFSYGKMENIDEPIESKIIKEKEFIGKVENLVQLGEPADDFSDEEIDFSKFKYTREENFPLQENLNQINFSLKNNRLIELCRAAYRGELKKEEIVEEENKILSEYVNIPKEYFSSILPSNFIRK